VASEDPDGDSNLFGYGLRFPGQYFDAETGLHYNYFRHYDPASGRFTQGDPIGLKGGINVYLYALANPIRWIDRFGLEECDPVAADAAERKRSEAAEREIEARSKGDWTGVEDAQEDQRRYIREYLRAMRQAGEDSTPKAPLPEPTPPEPKVPDQPAEIPMPTLKE
jgi:RHS repeat-associated protein